MGAGVLAAFCGGEAGAEELVGDGCDGGASECVVALCAGMSDCHGHFPVWIYQVAQPAAASTTRIPMMISGLRELPSSSSSSSK